MVNFDRKHTRLQPIIYCQAPPLPPNAWIVKFFNRLNMISVNSNKLIEIKFMSKQKPPKSKSQSTTRQITADRSCHQKTQRKGIEKQSNQKKGRFHLELPIKSKTTQVQLKGENRNSKQPNTHKNRNRNGETNLQLNLPNKNASGA